MRVTKAKTLAASHRVADARLHIDQNTRRSCFLSRMRKSAVPQAISPSRIEALSPQAGLLGIPSPNERSRETGKERSSQYGAAGYRSRAADQRVLYQSLAAGWRQIPSPRRMLPAGRALLSLRLLSQAPRVGGRRFHLCGLGCSRRTAPFHLCSGRRSALLERCCPRGAGSPVGPACHPKRRHDGCPGGGHGGRAGMGQRTNRPA